MNRHLVPYNPCGHAVQMMRAGYDTTARFFVDSDVEIGIRWMRCHPDAKPLPFPSVINSQYWQSEPWLREGVGEVYGAKRTFYGGSVVDPPPDDHICGTQEQFRGRAEYDPDIAPVTYRPNGLPDCCYPPWPQFYLPQYGVTLTRILPNKWFDETGEWQLVFVVNEPPALAFLNVTYSSITLGVFGYWDGGPWDGVGSIVLPVFFSIPPALPEPIVIERVE